MIRSYDPNAALRRISFVMGRSKIYAHRSMVNRIRCEMDFIYKCNEAYVSKTECACEECRTVNVDWTRLSNSEKMVKALLLRAKFAAELNEPL